MRALKSRVQATTISIPRLNFPARGLLHPRLASQNQSLSQLDGRGMDHRPPRNRSAPKGRQ